MSDALVRAALEKRALKEENEVREESAEKNFKEEKVEEKDIVSRFKFKHLQLCRNIHNQDSSGV